MAHHLSVVPALRKYHRRMRLLGDLERSIQQLEATSSQWALNPTSLRNNDMLKRHKLIFKVRRTLVPRRFAFRSLFSYGRETSTVSDERTMPMYFQKLQKEKACSDIGLHDQTLFRRCFQFYSSVSEFLLLVMTGKVDENTGTFLNVPLVSRSVQLPLNAKVPPEFASLPEWIVDDMADFLLFFLQ